MKHWCIVFKTVSQSLIYVLFSVLSLLMSSTQTVSTKGNECLVFPPAHAGHAIRIPTSILLHMGHPLGCLLSAYSPTLTIMWAINLHRPTTYRGSEGVSELWINAVHCIYSLIRLKQSTGTRRLFDFQRKLTLTRVVRTLSPQPSASWHHTSSNTTKLCLPSGEDEPLCHFSADMICILWRCSTTPSNITCPEVKYKSEIDLMFYGSLDRNSFKFQIKCLVYWSYHRWRCNQVNAIA